MTIPDSPLKRQKLVILGGTSGIGAAVAYAAAARGAEVVLASRRLSHAGEKNDALHLMQADLTDEASLHALFAAVGAFDHLVITAGPLVDAKPLAETVLEQAQADFNVKFWGSLRAVQAALPTLAPQGSITLTSGQLSRKYLNGQLVKTAINATEAYDGMSAAQRQALFERVSGSLPVGRIGQAADVAAGYLLAMENGFVTGSVIDIDGGGLL
nr:SDR family oxidoreductase [Serratia bockelmannii]